MKVKVKDLKPNPYRNMDKYPMDPFKIEALKNSIKETDFWDNILLRRKNGELQIAYGHHRLRALKELKIEEIDVPVKELDDATMIRIMANENMDDWKMIPAVINETVKATRDFLNTELAKYDSWENIKSANKSISSLFDSQASFGAGKKGVGQTTILKFLGKNWKQHTIQSALNTLDAEDLEIKAVETFDNVSQSDDFKKAVRTKNKQQPNRIPKELQHELAKKVKKRLEETKSSKSSNYRPAVISTIIEQELEGVDEFDATMNELTLEVENITSQVKQLKNKIASFNGKLLEMDVTNLKGIQTLFVVNEFSQLLTAINTMANYFGIQFDNLKDE